LLNAAQQFTAAENYSQVTFDLAILQQQVAAKIFFRVPGDVEYFFPVVLWDGSILKALEERINSFEIFADRLGDCEHAFCGCDIKTSRRCTRMNAGLKRVRALKFKT